MDEQENTVQNTSMIESMKYALGGVAGIEVFATIAHAGLPGMIALGIGAGYVTFKHGPQAAEYVHKNFVAPLHLDKRKSEDIPTPEPVQKPLTLSDDFMLLDDDEPRFMHLSSDWIIDIEDAIGKGIVCYGIKGAGKSNLGALLSEQFGQYHIPLVMFDIKPDYLTVVDVLPNGYIAGNPRMASKYPAGKFLAVDMDVVDEIGEAILTNGYQVVFDLTSYADDEARAQIMTAVVRSLMRFAATIDNDDRVPCLVFTDEASRWFPQDRSMKSPQMLPATQAALLHQFVEMANQGRSYGIIPCWFDQRPANFDKRLAAQSDIRVFMRQSQDIDIKRCKEIIGAELGAQVANFADGEGIVIIPKRRPFVTKFYKRESRAMSNTPRAEKAIERFGTASVQVPGTVPSTGNKVEGFQRHVKRVHKFTPSTRYCSEYAPGTGSDAQNEVITPVLGTVPNSVEYKRFTYEQETEFIRRFRVCGSIRETIAQMHISYGRYQKHASQIVSERRLKVSN